MASVNKVILIGRLGKDPEVKYAPSGIQITTFSLATSENIKKGDDWEEKTEWHNIVMFNKQAEYAGEQLKKGNMLYLEGKIQTRNWEDSEGVKRYKTDIIGNMFRNLSPKEKTEGGYKQPQSQTPAKNNFLDRKDGQQGSGIEDDLPF